MYVELRTQQRKAVERALERHDPGILELVVWWMERGSPVTPTTWATTMPAIGWKMVLEALTLDAFGRDGRGRGDARSSTRNAVKAVARGVSLRDGHPSLRGEATLGDHFEVLPAWNRDGGWSAYPLIGAAFVLLIPVHLTSELGPVTRWHAQHSPELRDGTLQDPEAHWQFRRRGDRTTR